FVCRHDRTSIYTATDAALIALGERFEKLLLEHMDAWLEWAPRMRAAHAEVRDNMAALAVAIQRTGCDVAQARMSELERDMQPLAEEIIAAPATSLAGLRAKALRKFVPYCGCAKRILERCKNHTDQCNEICHHRSGHPLDRRSCYVSSLQFAQAVRAVAVPKQGTQCARRRLRPRPSG